MEADVDADEPIEALDASAIEELLERISRPEFPLTRPWGLSIGDLLRARWELPSPVERLVRGLNRVGAIRLSPTGVGLDHADVTWSDLEHWPQVPGVLVHRARFGRAKESEGGLIAALLWAAVPEAITVLEQAAAAHGVPILRPPGP